MSIINVDSISDAAGTGSPSFPNGMSLNSLTTTGTVTAGDITLDNTNPIVKSADADGFLTLSGGTTTSLGTQIRLYSESHATAANDLTFRSGGSAVLIYNASTPVWNFQANDITTTGTVTAGDITLSKTTPLIGTSGTTGYLSISGDTASALGANLRLYGSAHATLADDILFRNDTTTVLKYDASVPEWNFIGNSLKTSGVVTAGDMNITGSSPVLTISDTDGTSQYASVYHSGGTTFIDSRNGTSNGPIRFRGVGGGVADEYARFISSGNFGIGDTNPSEALSVTGNIAATGTVTASGITLDNTFPFIKSNDADGFLFLSGGTSGALGGNMRLYGPTHASFANDILFRSNATGQLRYDSSEGEWQFGGNDIVTTGTVTADTVSLGTAPATLEHFVSSFSQVSNTYSTIHTFTAPAAGHYLFTISASLGSAVYGKLELTDGSTTLLSANWGYNNPHYSLFRTGLITLDGSTNVVFRGARNDSGGTVTMRGVQAYAVRLG